LIDWGSIFAKLVSAVMSWLDATNLRNRVYQLQEDQEILLTALDDIARIQKGTGSPSENIAKITLERFRGHSR
jgi:predicted KAP-like P-loop ATPase